MKYRIAIIIASVRDQRNASFVAEWLKTETEQYKGNLEFTFIDLFERAIPRYTSANIPAQRAYEDDFTKNWSKEIEQFDGFVVLTPEYNHSYPAVIKDAFDHLFHEWVYKPIAFVGYGTDGGVRAIEHLRLMSIQLAMAPIRRQVTIPIWEALEEGAPTLTTRFHDAVQEELAQLELWAQILKEARETKKLVL